MEAPFFELRNVSKYFAKVAANKDISFSIKKGEVLALLGENGAGKSTIMKILYGLYKADSGKILVNGEEKKIESPKDAMKLGISMIQQHFSLVSAHTVTENIILGNVKGKINLKSCEEAVSKLSEQYGFHVKANASIKDLSVGEQQKVEILKALYQKANLLIMDEPTAVLTPQESDNLMNFVREFTAKGNSVIFITHKLKEVMAVADRIIVMRDGEICGDLDKDKTNENELSYLMIGKDIEPIIKEDIENKDIKPVLRVENISYADRERVTRLKDVNFTINSGEVLGIAGVSGNGQGELCEVICGALKADEGKIMLDGVEITNTSIGERINLGIGYVPANRHRDGMVMDMTLAENMMLKTSYDKKWLKNGFIDKSNLENYTKKLMEEYDVKASGPNALAKELSGGNQQKVILAREVDTGSKLIIFDQPTRGLDLGAIDNVHKSILRERSEGRSVLLISTELSEIFALSDRIAVIYKGIIQGIYKPQELTTEKIGLLMAGYSGVKEGASNEEV